MTACLTRRVQFLGRLTCARRTPCVARAARAYAAIIAVTCSGASASSSPKAPAGGGAQSATLLASTSVAGLALARCGRTWSSSPRSTLGRAISRQTTCSSTAAPAAPPRCSSPTCFRRSPAAAAARTSARRAASGRRTSRSHRSRCRRRRALLLAFRNRLTADRLVAPRGAAGRGAPVILVYAQSTEREPHTCTGGGGACHSDAQSRLQAATLVGHTRATSRCPSGHRPLPSGAGSPAVLGRRHRRAVGGLAQRRRRDQGSSRAELVQPFGGV